LQTEAGPGQKHKTYLKKFLKKLTKAKKGLVCGSSDKVPVQHLQGPEFKPLVLGGKKF
jgi:hypothetical protein